jgi:hypothetical protein
MRWLWLLPLAFLLGYWVRGLPDAAPVDRVAPAGEFDPAIGYPNAYNVKPR